MSARGTTAQDERYYRGWRGCKKLHPPLLPHRSGTRPECGGTTAPEERYYRVLLRYYRTGVRYYRKGLRYYRPRERYYRKAKLSKQFA